MPWFAKTVAGKMYPDDDPARVNATVVPALHLLERIEPDRPDQRPVERSVGPVAVQEGQHLPGLPALVDDRLVGTVLVRGVGEELRVVGGASETHGLEDDLRAGHVDRLDHAQRRQGADVSLPDLQGRHESRI